MSDLTKSTEQFPAEHRFALICDDHPVVGRGLSEMLKAHPMVGATICTSSQQECLQRLRELPLPALVVADFWLHGQTVETLATTVKIMQIPLLVISADDDPMVQKRCQQWGAQGFVSKLSPPGVLREAVSSLLQGLGWFMPLAEHEGGAQDASSGCMQGASTSNRLTLSARELGLTPRQGQVLGMILLGQPNKRIAIQLSLTEATVKEHVTGIFQRLQVKSRIELIAKFQHRNLVA
jgi:DNA-binding NarL/FixJ family response regulator